MWITLYRINLLENLDGQNGLSIIRKCQFVRLHFNLWREINEETLKVFLCSFLHNWKKQEVGFVVIYFLQKHESSQSGFGQCSTALCSHTGKLVWKTIDAFWRQCLTMCYCTGIRSENFINFWLIWLVAQLSPFCYMSSLWFLNI